MNEVLQNALDGLRTGIDLVQDLQEKRLSASARATVGQLRSALMPVQMDLIRACAYCATLLGELDTLRVRGPSLSGRARGRRDQCRSARRAKALRDRLAAAAYESGVQPQTDPRENGMKANMLFTWWRRYLAVQQASVYWTYSGCTCRHRGHLARDAVSYLATGGLCGSDRSLSTTVVSAT